MSDEYAEHWVARARTPETRARIRRDLFDEQFAGRPDHQKTSRTRVTGEGSSS